MLCFMLLQATIRDDRESAGTRTKLHVAISASRNFDGDGSFTDWICHFESVPAVNGWSDQDKLLWIRVRLTGNSHVAYTRLSHETRQAYATTKKALCKRFEPPSKRQLYKVEFESRRKRDKESWADFGNELLLLSSKAFSDF